MLTPRSFWHLKRKSAATSNASKPRVHVHISDDSDDSDLDYSGLLQDARNGRHVQKVPSAGVVRGAGRARGGESFLQESKSRVAITSLARRAENSKRDTLGKGGETGDREDGAGSGMADVRTVVRSSSSSSEGGQRQRGREVLEATGEAVWEQGEGRISLYLGEGGFAMIQELTLSRAENDGLQAENEALQDQVERFRLENARLHAQLRAAQTQDAVRLQTIGQAEAEIAGMTVTQERVTTEVRKLCKEISQLQTELEESRAREQQWERVCDALSRDLQAEQMESSRLRKIADMVHLGYQLARERNRSPDRSPEYLPTRPPTLTSNTQYVIPTAKPLSSPAILAPTFAPHSMSGLTTSARTSPTVSPKDAVQRQKNAQTHIPYSPTPVYTYSYPALHTKMHTHTIPTLFESEPEISPLPSRSALPGEISPLSPDVGRVYLGSSPPKYQNLEKKPNTNSNEEQNHASASHDTWGVPPSLPSSPVVLARSRHTPWQEDVAASVPAASGGEGASSRVSQWSVVPGHHTSSDSTIMPQPSLPESSEGESRTDQIDISTNTPATPANPEIIKTPRITTPRTKAVLLDLQASPRQTFAKAPFFAKSQSVIAGATPPALASHDALSPSVRDGEERQMLLRDKHKEEMERVRSEQREREKEVREGLQGLQASAIAVHQRHEPAIAEDWRKMRDSAVDKRLQQNANAAPPLDSSWTPSEIATDFITPRNAVCAEDGEGDTPSRLERSMDEAA